MCNMNLEAKRFGRGNKELGGAQDLINQYRLLPYYEFFCKSPLPLSMSETHYLNNVVGDTRIRKGEGMELNQLCKNTNMSEKKACLSPFDLDVLNEAFRIREMDPIHLSSAQKERRNVVPKLENQTKENARKDRRVKDIHKEGEKNGKHRLHQVKDGSCIENNRIRLRISLPLQSKNQQDKKRRTETSNDPSVNKRLNTRQ